MLTWVQDGQDFNAGIRPSASGQNRNVGRWKRGRIRAVTEESDEGGSVVPRYDVALDDTACDAAVADLTGVAAKHVLSNEQGGVGAMLCKAAAQGKPELVRVLLDAGVSVFASDDKANTALLHAVRPESVQNACKLDQWGALLEVCKLLVERGADLHGRNIWRQNAYDFALLGHAVRADAQTSRPSRPHGVS